MRFRETYNKHLQKVANHTRRFIEGHGTTANHFSEFDTDMMKSCINLKVTMDKFLSDYKDWIKRNSCDVLSFHVEPKEVQILENEEV